MLFTDRHEAGIQLAEKLSKYRDIQEATVLAIPRGGVEVGYEIAKSLNVGLNIIVTKKIGLPSDEEFAIGSVGPDKKVMINKDALRIYNVPKGYMDEQSREIGREIERRYKAYKGKYELESLEDKIVILADDGIATGFTTRVAIDYIKSQKPKRIILAVPVAPADVAEEFQKEVDEFVCLHSTKVFSSISQFYDDFPQLKDEDVKKFLSKS